MKIIREFLGKDVYKIILYCWNCGKFTDVYIHKGVSVYDYLSSPEHKKCPNCSCLTLEKARMQ